MRLALSTLLLFFALGAPAQEPVAQENPPEKGEERPGRKISKIEAKRLLQSVDRILDWVSNDTRLPIKEKVKREIASREQVTAHVRERMKEDEDAQRIKDAQLVLKKFGLLPRQFDFESFIVSLYGEQVAGFYDFRKKTIYMLDWVEPAAQEPVLAHELTHALQDQNRDLEKWMKEARDLGERSRSGEHTEGLVDADEHMSARSAVTEGQGMVVLLNFVLAPRNLDVMRAPEFVEQLKAGMLQRGGSPIFDNAPLLMREMLVFPYNYGLGFIRDVMFDGGREKAFAGTLNKPPRNTHQVMYPKSYLEGRETPPIPLPPMKKILKEKYDELDVGSIGQFDVQVMFKEYGGDRSAGKLTPEWRGGVYYAAWQKDAKKKDKEQRGTGDVAVMYLSRWTSKKAAQDVAIAYANGLKRRYQKVQANEISGGDVVRSEYETEEGKIFIHVLDDMLLITESFDAETAEQLRQAVVEQQAAPAAVAQTDLAFRAMPGIFADVQRNMMLRSVLQSARGISLLP